MTTTSINLDPATHPHNTRRGVLLIAIMILIMSTVFWLRANKLFQNDSEGLVVGMLDAQKYGFDVSSRGYGLGQFYPTGITGDYHRFVNHTYESYYHGMLEMDYTFDIYDRQIGLQGWIFYALSAFIPHALSALRFACCIALSTMISLLSWGLYRRFGLLFAASFYLVSLNSGWLADFSPNLYWVPFTWYIPLFLGLLSVVFPQKRKWIYPLVALSLFIKSACGYEYLTVVMLSAVFFPALEWLLSIKKKPAQARQWFFTAFWIGVSCLVGFIAAFCLHALIRGSGNLMQGIRDIVEQDALRRTFGTASEFAAEFTPSLNASVLTVLGRYISPLHGSATAQSMFWLSVINLILLSVNGIWQKKLPLQDALLLAGSWLVCTSWFILAKAHSFDHTYINPVLWYVLFAQTAVYLAVRQGVILSRSLSQLVPVRLLFAKLAEDTYAEL